MWRQAGWRQGPADHPRPRRRAGGAGKLVEEVEEFLDSEELADVLEVLVALTADFGVDRDQLEKLREAKAFERGGFGNRIVWSGNQPTPATILGKVPERQKP